jgi:peptidoglycan/LPS O-acetylase OafA/YrhL
MSGWLDMAGCAGLTIIPWPALVLVAWLQKTLKRAAPAGLRVLLRVSGMAFALYCIHEPLLAVLEKASAAGHPWAGLLAYAAAVLLAAGALDAVDRKLRGGAA